MFGLFGLNMLSKIKPLTWTPNIPKIIKNVQHMRTMFPIGRKDDNNVCTTNFKPGALFITLKGRKDLSNRNT